VTSRPSHLDILATTAWWSAAARARETERSDRLFDDPWAMTLAGRQFVEEFNLAIAGHGGEIVDLHATVTRFFDDFLLRITRELGISQVVLVASGLDCRAFRLNWPSGTRLFELDQPHVIAYKNCRLDLMGAAPQCLRDCFGVDLNGQWRHALCRGGFNPAERSVWLFEGCLYFFAESAVSNLLKIVTSLSAKGSYMAADLVNERMLTCPATRHWTDRMSSAGAPWLFTSDEPEALLASLGWSANVVRSGEDGADFGRVFRLKESPSPLGSPLSLLVTATRDRLAAGFDEYPQLRWPQERDGASPG